MTLKEKILKILIKSSESVSGATLAKECGVSRNAVWKAINSLKTEGYEISGVNKVGYKLVGGDILSAEELKCLLGDRVIEVYNSIGSTNARAKELACIGVPGGSLVAASEQTKGRGRFNRPFVSKNGVGLYMSLILRPNIPMSECMKLTAYAAVATADALECFGVNDVKIKWVNDLYLNGKKICGILTEGSADFESGGLEYAVVGIGINLGEIEFSDELKDKATSVYNETGIKIPRCVLAAEIVKRIENATSDYMKKYRDRSCVIGKLVKVNNGCDNFEGLIKDIDKNGFLIVERNGTDVVVNAGEVIMK